MSGDAVRINKFLSEAGAYSRREADRLLLEGRVRVEEKVAQLGDKVLPGQRVFLDGKEVGGKAAPVLLLFYKPAGYVCSTKRQGDAPTVMDLLSYPTRVFPVGRLDKDSEGLLLFTNEGELSDALLRAANYHEKEYLVTVDRPFGEEFLREMGKGVPILDTVTRPCKVFRTGKDSFRIILTQGLNRQIRRMCEALGFKVKSLRRIRICSLYLKGLAPGAYRPATKEERESLWKELRNGAKKGENRGAGRSAK